MTGRITATRRGGITVELDADHRTLGGPATITLPTAYVGAHVDYGYARTVDTAQGVSVDHSLFTPSAAASAERTYVALSRGRQSNRIYATPDGAWIDAIGRTRNRTQRARRDQSIGGELRRASCRRSVAQAHDHDVPLEL